jgi:predicted DsbA family dithiol-disulfide isomerase
MQQDENSNAVSVGMATNNAGKALLTGRRVISSRSYSNVGWIKQIDVASGLGDSLFNSADDDSININVTQQPPDAGSVYLDLSNSQKETLCTAATWDNENSVWWVACRSLNSSNKYAVYFLKVTTTGTITSYLTTIGGGTGSNKNGYPAIFGDKKAPITIVAFSDFQCPYCKRGFETVSQVEKKYGKEVRFVFRHFPLPFHSMAKPAAEYFEAIALQSPEKAYLFHDEVFRNQNLLEPEKEKFLDKATKKAGADMNRLKADLKSPEVKARIQNDMDEGQKLGVRGTPKFFINGVSLTGARPLSDFESIIDRWLKKI